MDWRLYFLRHGIAADRAEDGSYYDAGRPLTEVGRHRTALVARALKQFGGSVDIIYHSPLLRARQTAEIAADELGVERVEVSDLLYPGREPSELMHLFSNGRQPGENLMLVGHQPHMSQSVAWASGGNGALMDMKKAGLACVRFQGNMVRGPGVLEWLLTPKWIKSIFPDETW